MDTVYNSIGAGIVGDRDSLNIDRERLLPKINIREGGEYTEGANDMDSNTATDIHGRHTLRGRPRKLWVYLSWLIILD